MAESRTPPDPTKFSFTGQLQERLGNEAERRMRELESRHLKAVMALVESLQLELALENIQTYDPVQNAKHVGKNEAFLEVAQEMFGRLMELQEQETQEEGEQ